MTDESSPGRWSYSFRIGSEDLRDAGDISWASACVDNHHRDFRRRLAERCVEPSAVDAEADALMARALDPVNLLQVRVELEALEIARWFAARGYWYDVEWHVREMMRPWREPWTFRVTKDAP